VIDSAPSAPLIKKPGKSTLNLWRFAQVYGCGGFDLNKEQKFRQYLMHGKRYLRQARCWQLNSDKRQHQLIVTR